MELNKDSKSYFDVLGICCSSEVPMIEKLLKNLDGVKEVSVVVPTKTVIVVHDSLVVSQIQIVKALNRERLEANIRVYGEQNYKNKWPSPYAMASGVLLLLSFLKYVYSPLQWLAVGAIAVGIPPILLKAVAAVRNFSLDVNILVLIAVAGSVTLRDYWEAATIVFLFTIAEWLESRASHKATAAMSSLVSLVPQKAILAETGEEIDVDKVMLNAVLVVKAGEIIPIDGVVLEGNCEVDEKILTGESFPVSKEKDSTVWASTINLNGYITIRTTAVVEDCVVSRMAKLVEEAQNNKSRTQRILDKCAKYYTPAIVLIAACLALVPLLLHVKNRNQWYHLALVVLVSGCPCALLLSTPVAMFCALSKAATMGVLFKGAEHVETLAEIKIMAFDKTGTITRGEFLVSDVRTLRDDISLNTMLYWISSLESKSSHPMAAALVDFAIAQGVEPKPDEVEKFQNFPGEGIRGNIGDNEIYIGNRKIASRTGCTAVPNIEGYETEGKSVGYVFSGSLPVGIFCIADICRTGAKEAIRELKLLGIKTAMLTGDSHAAAKHTQAQLMDALEVIHSELLPEDKARIIKEFQKEGLTAMLGDGINDALALTTANVGISMGVSGSALATESGDIILMSNDIQKVPKAVRLARKVRRKIIENVIISITTKAAIVALAIAGHPLVWAAVLTDVGTCLLVICNSMLLLKGMPKREKKSCQSGNKHKHKCNLLTACFSHHHDHHEHQDHHHHEHDHLHDHHSSCSDIQSQKKVASGCCSSSDASLTAHMLCSPKENGHKAHDHSHHHHEEVQKHGSCDRDHNHNHNHDHHSTITDIESQMKVASGCCSSDTSSRAHRKEHGHKAHNHSHHHHEVAQESVLKVQKHGSCDRDHHHNHNHNHNHDHHSSISDIESQMKVASGCCSSDTSSRVHEKEHGHKAHDHSHQHHVVQQSILEVHKHGCCENTKGIEKNCIAKHERITSCKKSLKQEL